MEVYCLIDEIFTYLTGKLLHILENYQTKKECLSECENATEGLIFASRL